MCIAKTFERMYWEWKSGKIKHAIRLHVLHEYFYCLPKTCSPCRFQPASTHTRIYTVLVGNMR